MDLLLDMSQGNKAPGPAPFVAGILKPGSQAHALAKFLHSLPPLTVGANGDDDQDPPEAMEIDLPESFDVLPDEMIWRIVMPMLDPRNLGPIDPERDLRAPETYRQRILNRIPMLLDRFGKLRAVSSRMRSVVMDPSFRNTMYRRWYVRGSMVAPSAIQETLQTPDQALQFPIPELRMVGPPKDPKEPERKRRRPRPLPVGWYRTLLYNAILAEHLYLVVLAASKITLARGAHKNWIDQAWLLSRVNHIRSASLLFPSNVPKTATGNADDDTMNTVLVPGLLKAGMLWPGALDTAIDHVWKLKAQPARYTAVFPGSSMLGDVEQLWSDKTDETRWDYFRLLADSVNRSSVWRIPDLVYRGVQGVNLPRRDATFESRMVIEGSYVARPLLLLDEVFIPAPQYTRQQLSQYGMPHTFRFAPILVPGGARVRVKLFNLNLVWKDLSEEWVSHLLRRARLINRTRLTRYVRSRLTLGEVFHRQGEVSAFQFEEEDEKAYTDGEFVLFLEEDIRVARPREQLQSMIVDVKNSNSSWIDGNWRRITYIEVYPKIPPPPDPEAS